MTKLSKKPRGRGETASSGKSHTIMIVLARELYDKAKELVLWNNSNVSEVLRQALKLSHDLALAQKTGCRIVVLPPEGKKEPEKRVSVLVGIF